jgi:hypothetical protein
MLGPRAFTFFLLHAFIIRSREGTTKNFHHRLPPPGAYVQYVYPLAEQVLYLSRELLQHLPGIFVAHLPIWIKERLIVVAELAR